jgi:hypothetical protein
MRPDGHSGRRFVLVAGLVLVVLWGVLFAVFSNWRARYRARAAYGLTHVVTALDPLEAIVPANVSPDEWHDAVDRTKAMLKTVVSSNLLDLTEMKRLHAEIDQFVARARAQAETGPRELAGIWDLMTERAQFLFRDSRYPDGTRHVRPKLLPPEPGKPGPGGPAARPEAHASHDRTVSRSAG